MIRFFYGAGSEGTKKKLTDCIKEDLAAGGHAILLVPEQETVSVERRMLELLPPATQLTFEVLNFSRLANRVFRRLGGLSHHAASPAVSALYMWQALSEVSVCLRQYGQAAAKDSSLCQLMLATASRCKAACITPEALLEAAETLPENDPLRDKLNDIGLILSTFELRLGEKFENGKDDLTRLAEKLEKSGKELLHNTHVYIDSFTDFTAQEMAVIRAIMKAAPTVSVTFPLTDHNATEGLHLTSVLQTHKKLFAMAKSLGQRVYYEEEMTEAPQNILTYLSQNIFKMSAEKAPLSMAHGKIVKIYACDSPFEEATAIATQIHRLIRTGCRYRDIAVVVRDATSWNGILDDALEREGIPCFISEKTDITLRPLIKLILGALHIHRRCWRAEDVVSYLKTGLCGISQTDVNLFEEYLSVWRLKGEKAYTSAPFSKNPDGFKTAISPRGARILEASNRVREAVVPPLVSLFSALNNAKCVTDLCRAIFDFLNILDIPEKLRKQAHEQLQAGERREAEELSRLYNVTVDALESISAAMGDRPMSVAEFADALKLVFSHTDIGSIPTSADEVTIGSASMLRADHPRFVLIAGLNDGVFPATVKDDGLLGEADCRRLTELGIEFPSGNEKKMSDELFYAYRALSAPRDGLFLFYSLHGTDGRALSPSVVLSRVHALFPQLQEKTFASIPHIERVFTRNGAIEAFTELPDMQKALLPKEILHSVGNGVNTVERRARVSPETAKKLFERGKFNPTHLENYASCRFKYYCSKILKLREEADGTMSSAETGSFIHHVLEQVMNAVKQDRSLFSSMNAEMQAELVQKSCNAYRQELIRAGGELTPRTEALFRRLSELAKLIVSGLFAEFSDSLFSPAFLELSLAEIGENAAVTMPDGERIPLSGQIDRVDYWQAEDGRVFLRVTDYKTGSKSFRLEDVEKGFCLQMPLYLLALCRGQHNALCHRLGLPENTPFLPAGITYLSSNISTEKTECKKDRETAMADAVERLNREGLLLQDEDVRYAMSTSGNKSILGSSRSKTQTALSSEQFDALFESLEGSIGRIATRMRSGDADVSPLAHGGTSPCEYCAYIAVCRAAQKGKE